MRRRKTAGRCGSGLICEAPPAVSNLRTSLWGVSRHRNIPAVTVRLVTEPRASLPETPERFTPIFLASWHVPCDG